MHFRWSFSIVFGYLRSSGSDGQKEEERGGRGGGGGGGQPLGLCGLAEAPQPDGVVGAHIARESEGSADKVIVD